MVGLTREQRREKNCRLFDDRIQKSWIYLDHHIENTSTLVCEIEQELMALIPTNTNTKISNWEYDAVSYGRGFYAFFVEINPLKAIQKRPYLQLRRIEIPEKLRNKGYATSILKILIAKSKEYGYDGVAIESIGSPVMQHVAEKLGFTPIANSKDYILITKD